MRWGCDIPMAIAKAASTPGFPPFCVPSSKRQHCLQRPVRCLTRTWICCQPRGRDYRPGAWRRKPQLPSLPALSPVFIHSPCRQSSGCVLGSAV